MRIISVGKISVEKLSQIFDSSCPVGKLNNKIFCLRHTLLSLNVQMNRNLLHFTCEQKYICKNRLSAAHGALFEYLARNHISSFICLKNIFCLRHTKLFLFHHIHVNFFQAHWSPPILINYILIAILILRSYAALTFHDCYINHISSLNTHKIFMTLRLGRSSDCISFRLLFKYTQELFY